MTRPSGSQLAERPRHPVAALLEDIRSIHNVGSIFRTADAARLQHLWLTGITGTPEHRKLRKTSLGAERSVPWTHEEDALATARRLRSNGCTLLALEITDQPTSVDELTLDSFPVCVLSGNELNGVSDALLEESKGALSIPQFGQKHSLNVSVAFGIAVYDLVRRYRHLAGLPPRPSADPAPATAASPSSL